MMKTLTALSLGALLVIAGCHTGERGGPGATDSSSVSAPENTFTIENVSTTIRQGETKAIAIALNRGKNFDEDVALSFSELPRGITIDNPRPVISHGDKAAKFNMTAAPDAALGEFTIKVTGHPTRGGDALNDFGLKVEPRPATTHD
jgi:hypothetical protein